MLGRNPEFFPSTEGLESGVSSCLADHSPLGPLCVVATCVSDFLEVLGIGVLGDRGGLVVYSVQLMEWGVLEHLNSWSSPFGIFF